MSNPSFRRSRHRCEQITRTAISIVTVTIRTPVSHGKEPGAHVALARPLSSIPVASTPYARWIFPCRRLGRLRAVSCSGHQSHLHPLIWQ